MTLKRLYGGICVWRCNITEQAVSDRHALRLLAEVRCLPVGKECSRRKACMARNKAEADLTPTEWLEASEHRSGPQRGRCKECMARNKPQAALRRCAGESQEMKAEADFTPRECA